MTDESKPADEVDTEKVQAFLKDHLPEPGAIRYRVELEGKQDNQELVKHTTFLAGLRSFRTHYNQGLLQKLIEKVCNEKEESWHLSTEKTKFSRECATMIRAMLRDVSQGLTKLKSKRGRASKDPPVPAWLKPFFEEGADAGNGPKDAEKKDHEYMYRYDPVAKSAYRAGRDQEREYCLRMVCSEDESAEMEAEWQDGDKWKVPGLSCADYKQAKSGVAVVKTPLAGSAKQASKTKPSEWEGKDNQGGLVVVKKSSAKLKEWIILWHYPKGDDKNTKQQVAQIVLSTLSKENSALAVDFMVQVGKEFANNELKKDHITALKTTFLAGLKLPKPTKAASTKRSSESSASIAKRPATKVDASEDEAAAEETGAGPGAADEDMGEAEPEDDYLTPETTNHEEASPTGEVVHTSAPSLSDYMPPASNPFD